MEANGAPFTPSLCQCSVLGVFEAIATWIRGNLKEMLKSRSIKLGSSCSEIRPLIN